jgi:hypothetical protein
MKGPVKIAISIAVPAMLLCVASLQFMCRHRGNPANDPQRAATLTPDATVTATAATTLPAGPTSVRVSIMMVVHKKYGVLARMAGKRNVTKTDEPYDEAKSWWDNPMVIHQDASFPSSGVSADADSAAIAGRGDSSNVSVELTLVPHADITLDTLVISDCLKGTITATITTQSDYYDGKWTPVARATNSPVAFHFDTSDKSRPARPTTTESRMMPPFSFERYTRDREKWEPKSAWPTKPRSGDWRSTIYVKDVKLVMTGYQYVGRVPAETADSATQPGATIP